MPGKVGFFLMPTLKAGGKHTAMSAPLTYGIAAKAKHADCAAFFFNWVATNPAARKFNVAVGGSNPGWARRACRCPCTEDGLGDRADARGGRRSSPHENGAMDFIANATGAIYAQSWTPEVQKLFAGQETPQDVLSEGAVGLRAAGQERRLVHDQPLHAAEGTASTVRGSEPGKRTRRRGLS